MSRSPRASTILYCTFTLINAARAVSRHAPLAHVRALATTALHARTRLARPPRCPKSSLTIIRGPRPGALLTCSPASMRVRQAATRTFTRRLRPGDRMTEVWSRDTRLRQDSGQDSGRQRAPAAAATHPAGPGRPCGRKYNHNTYFIVIKLHGVRSLVWAHTGVVSFGCALIVHGVVPCLSLTCASPRSIE